MTQLTIAPLSTVHPAIHCVNPDCAVPYPQKRGNKFCQSCGSPILLNHRYLPLQRLGCGGFAVTYTVYDRQTQQERVLKVLTETSPKAVALFEQEAQVLARLLHPGIPQVEPDSYFEIAVGHSLSRSLHCLVMEKINGQTLEEMLQQNQRGFSEARVIFWFQQAIDILGLLHQQQIIHRDLKPANFMLRQDTNQLVVIDFGGAKQHHSVQSGSTQASSTRLVSPGYSPPEQVAGSTVQPASDFYALGRTLIHLLTGRYPPDLEDPMTGALQWRSYAQVSSDLAELLDEMVRCDVQQRPGSAEVIRARLGQFAPSGRQRTEGRGQKAGVASGSFKSKVEWVAQGRRRAISRGRSSAQTLMQAMPTRTAATANSNQSQQLAQKSAQKSAGLQTRAAEKSIGVSTALRETLWSAILAGGGGGLGTLLGFQLGYGSPLGVQLSLWLWQSLRATLPFLPVQLGPELFVFAAAGFGTALGLTLAGGFQQRRHPIQASLMGGLGYLGGMVGLHVAALDGVLPGLVAFAELAAIFLTLGLGLPRPRWLYPIVAAIGTTLFLVGLATANVWFMVDFWQFLYPEMAGIGATESSSLACLVLFGLMGAVVSGCLGISRYGLAPVFRWFH